VLFATHIHSTSRSPGFRFYLVHELHLLMPDMVNKSAVFYMIDRGAAFVTGWVTDFWIRRGAGLGVVRKSGMILGWLIAAAGFLGCAWAGPDS
jgi:hypothetical protein